MQGEWAGRPNQAQEVAKYTPRSPTGPLVSENISVMPAFVHTTKVGHRFVFSLSIGKPARLPEETQRASFPGLGRAGNKWHGISLVGSSYR